MNMVSEVEILIRFVWDAFATNWWLIALSVPLAVVARLSGIGEAARRGLERNGSVSIVIATLFGAFSPLCSCSVIPVVFGLLTAGVPLAPIMSFWIASPSMDPEIFLLSVTTIGWPLSITRLVATLAISLSAGYVTAYFQRRGVLDGVVRGEYRKRRVESLFKIAWRRITLGTPTVASAAAMTCQCTTIPQPALEGASCSSCATVQRRGSIGRPPWRTVVLETISTSLFVAKFVLLAFFLEAIIVRYVPQETVISLIGGSSVLAPVWATIAGIPLYTTTIASLGLVGGLLDQGMSHGAAIAFLIAGPTTTVPAMAAVYNVVSKRVFALYVAIPTVGALVVGIGWQLVR